MKKIQRIIIEYIIVLGVMIFSGSATQEQGPDNNFLQWGRNHNYDQFKQCAAPYPICICGQLAHKKVKELISNPSLYQKPTLQFTLDAQGNAHLSAGRILTQGQLLYTTLEWCIGEIAYSIETNQPINMTKIPERGVQFVQDSYSGLRSSSSYQQLIEMIREDLLFYCSLHIDQYMRDIWEPEKQWHEKQQSVKIMVLPDMHGNYPTLQMNQVSQPDALIILGDWLEKFEIERVRNDIFKNDANPHVDRSLITTFQQWAAPLFNVTTTTPIIVPGNKERNSTYRADSYQNIPANRWVFLNQCASQSSEPTRNPTYVVLKNHVIVLGYTTTARPEDRDPRWGKQSDQTNRLMDHLRSACSANPQCNKILLAAHEKLVELATSGTLKAMRRAAPNHSILILTSHDHTESLRWMIEKGKIDNPKNPFPNYFKVSDFSKWFKGGWISLQSIGSSNFRESEYQNMYWNAPPPFGLCPTVLEIPASLP